MRASRCRRLFPHLGGEAPGQLCAPPRPEARLPIPALSHQMYSRLRLPRLAAVMLVVSLAI